MWGRRGKTSQPLTAWNDEFGLPTLWWNLTPRDWARWATYSDRKGITDKRILISDKWSSFSKPIADSIGRLLLALA